MSVPNVYCAGGINCYFADLSAAAGFAALANQNVDLGTQFRTVRKFASVYEAQAAISRQDPEIAFATTQVKSFLDLFGLTGRCITADPPTKFGFDAFLAQHDPCAVRDLTDCRQFRFVEGYVAPGTLQVAHGGMATITGRAIGSSSTANHPLAIADGVAAPTGLADTESYGLYNQTVAGVDLTGVKNLSIESGIEVTTESADAGYWPEWVSVGSLALRITLSGINPKWLTAATGAPVSGQPWVHGADLANHADTTLRLVRHAVDGTGAYMDLTAEEHITMTVAGVVGITTAAAANDETGAATTDLVIVALHDGTNVPIIPDTTAALAA